MFQIFKGICSRDVVYQNNTVCTPVIRTCQRSKAFLSSRIPNSELDPPSTHVQMFHFEINTNSGLNVLVEGIIGEPKEHRRLEVDDFVNDVKIFHKNNDEYKLQGKTVTTGYLHFE